MEETDKLNSLFDAVADELLTKIKTGEAKPADLAVAVKFLKDNNISCLPVDGNSLEALMKTMPFSSDDKLSYNSFQVMTEKFRIPMTRKLFCR